MRIRLLNALLLAALALALSRLWLVLSEPPPSLPALTQGEAASAGGEPPSEQEAEAVEVKPEAYDVIAARDLFSPTRGIVPPAPVDPARPARPAAPPQAPAPPVAPKLTLYGVVIVDGVKTAFLQEGSQEGRPRKVKENDHFAGGVVKAIRPDGVTFLFGGTEINVALRTPKPGVATQPPRDQDTGVFAPQAEGPAESQRRQRPAGVRQMPIPAQGRALPPPGGMQSIIPTAEPGSEIFGTEEFPEGSPMPEEEMPGMMPGEAGE